jgi:pimeloyl-ACP methyl ester carboxylesterase
MPRMSAARIGFLKAMFGTDFAAWTAIRLMPVLPASFTHMILGTDPALVEAASPDEQARVRRVLDGLLPASPRADGMAFDIKTATTPEPYALEKISCPVLTVSAADDAFGTALRAKVIAEGVPSGRAVIYPAGGHALAGRYRDVLRDVLDFLQANPPAKSNPAL